MERTSRERMGKRRFLFGSDLCCEPSVELVSKAFRGV